MSDLQIIPSVSELSKIEAALPQLDQLESQIAGLEQRAQALEVTSAESMAEAGACIREIKSVRESAKATLRPFDLAISRVKDFLRERLQKITNRGELAHAICTKKMSDYDARERELVAIEQKRLDRAAARTGAEAGTVTPNVPTMAGARRTVTYSVGVLNKDKFIHECLKRLAKHDDSLLRFLVIDEAELRAVARSYQDPERMMKEVPFIKVTEKVNFGGKV